MAYGGFSRAGQQFKESLLIRGLDGENIDQGEKFAVRGDRCHRLTRESGHRKDQLAQPRSPCDDGLAGSVPMIGSGVDEHAGDRLYGRYGRQPIGWVRGGTVAAGRLTSDTAPESRDRLRRGIFSRTAILRRALRSPRGEAG